MGGGVVLSFGAGYGVFMHVAVIRTSQSIFYFMFVLAVSVQWSFRPTGFAPRGVPCALLTHHDSLSCDTACANTQSFMSEKNLTGRGMIGSIRLTP